MQIASDRRANDEVHGGASAAMTVVAALSGIPQDSWVSVRHLLEETWHFLGGDHTAAPMLMTFAADQAL